MQFDKRGKVDPISTAAEVAESLGGMKVSEYSGLKEVEPHNSLVINHGMGDHKRVEELVKQYHQDPKFLEVANALLGEHAVAKILNG